MTDDSEHLQALECGELAAIVRRVSLAEFSAEALRSRFRDPVWLEAAVRSHNQVIVAIHQEQPILPAKFGCVYARAEDLTVALHDAHARLIAQLDHLAGCDEWGVHVYADRDTIQQHVAEQPTLQQLQQELVTARPGRAYFLRRRLDDELAATTGRVISELGQLGYDPLVRCAVDAEVNPLPRPSGDATGEIEILRAAFLVARESVDRFAAEVRSFHEGHPGLRCACSGPWPPYSFAAPIG